MRICHIVTSLEMGGMERVVCDLLASSSGYLFCTDSKGQLFAGALAQAKKCGGRRARKLVVDWGVVWKLVRFIRVHKIECLHAHNHVAHLYAVLASVLTCTPVVVTLHGQGYYDTPRTLKLRRWLSRLTKAVVVVSNDAGEVVVKSGAVPRRKIMIIPNGVDTFRFSPASFRREGVSPVCIGSIGRLAPEKNYPLLIRAFSRLIAGKTESEKEAIASNKITRGKTRFNIDRQDAQDKGLGDSSCKSCISMLPPSFLTIEGAKESFNIDGQDAQDKGLGDSSCKSCISMLPPSFLTIEGAKESFNIDRQDAQDKGLGASSCKSCTSMLPPSFLTIEGAKESFNIDRQDAQDKGLGGSSCKSCISMLTSRLLLVGDGSERGHIESVIRDLGLTERCTLTGMQSNVLPWLHQMDVFCLSSDTEGLSMTLLEACACGLPCVVTDVGGNAEIVAEGVSGYVVPKGDESAIAEALECLAVDTKLRQEMGRAARKTAEENFSLTAMVAGYTKVYEMAVGMKGGGDGL